MSLRLTHYFAIVILFASIADVRAQGNGATDSRKALDDVFAFFGGNADWKSDELAGKVKRIMTEYPASSEALTAKLFYASHLQALQKPEDMNEEQRLYREITTTSPGSWQASLAWLNLTATYGFQGNYRQQLIVASTALAKIDFQALEASNDKDFQRLLTLYSTPASDIEDALRLLLAKAQAKMGNLAAAENVMNTVQSTRLKQAASDGIDFQKKVLAIKHSIPKSSVPGANPSPTANADPDTPR